MTTGHLDTTKYNAQVANAASQVKISSTVFKDFIADVKDKVDSNYDLFKTDYDNAIGMQRQALINGNFDVGQRGTTFTSPAANTYTSDRWKVAVNPLTGTLPANVIHSRQSLTPGDVSGSYYFYRLNVDGSGSGQYRYQIQQPIEFGVRHLCGLNKKVTVSFYAKSSIANKKIGVSLTQNYGTGGTPSALEALSGGNITLTSSWVKYTFTITTNTLVGKTFGTNNDDQLTLLLTYAWDSATQANYGAVTAETFVGAGNIDIAQVQVNAGDQALPFQPRSFVEELALCQRYYEKSYNQSVNAGGITDEGTTQWFSTGGNFSGTTVYFKVKKRANPTITVYSPTTGTASKVRNNALAADINGNSYAPSENGFKLQANNIATTLNDEMKAHWTADADF